MAQSLSSESQLMHTSSRAHPVLVTRVMFTQPCPCHTCHAHAALSMSHVSCGPSYARNTDHITRVMWAVIWAQPCTCHTCHVSRHMSAALSMSHVSCEPSYARSPVHVTRVTWAVICTQPCPCHTCHVSRHMYAALSMSHVSCEPSYALNTGHVTHAALSLWPVKYVRCKGVWSTFVGAWKQQSVREISCCLENFETSDFKGYTGGLCSNPADILKRHRIVHLLWKSFRNYILLSNLLSCDCR